MLTTRLATLALGLMPLLLHLYAKGLYHGNLQGKVASLVMTLVPCAIGIFLKEHLGMLASALRSVGVGELCSLACVFPTSPKYCEDIS